MQLDTMPHIGTFLKLSSLVVHCWFPAAGTCRICLAAAEEELAAAEELAAVEEQSRF